MDYLDLIPNIIKGMELKKGSIVLLNFWGENNDFKVLDKFAVEVAKTGSLPIRWQQSRELTKTYFEEMREEDLVIFDKYSEIYKLANVVIDIFMNSVAPHRDFPKDKYPLYSAYMRKLFTTLNEGKDLFIQVRVPTEENAVGEDMSFKAYNDAMCNAASVDMKKLKGDCVNLVQKIEGMNKVEIYTGNGKVLTFALGERKWNKDDGTGDIPPGEIYIAPIEDSAEGEVLIPAIFIEGECLNDVLLKFRAGKLIESSSSELMNFIKQFQGDYDVLAEFGIGLNENIKELSGCTVIDEKIKGTAHIAIGMNNMFGGKNNSQLHMDFIFKPQKIVMDGKIIMEGTEII